MKSLSHEQAAKILSSSRTEI